MRTDKKLVDRILIEITKEYPFSLKDVRAYYNGTGSIDRTIEACEKAVDEAIDLYWMLEKEKSPQSGA